MVHSEWFSPLLGLVYSLMEVGLGGCSGGDCFRAGLIQGRFRNGFLDLEPGLGCSGLITGGFGLDLVQVSDCLKVDFDSGEVRVRVE